MALTTPVIRGADPHEFAAIGELTVAAYAAGGGLALGAEDPYAEVLRDPASRPPGTTVLLATDPVPGGLADPGDPDARARPLGALTYIPAGLPLSQVSKPGEAEIRMLAVAPDAQGRGIGAALVRTAVAMARAEGRVALVLCVVSTNAGARSLYERLGFARTPARDWAPPGLLSQPALVLLGYRLSLD